MLLHCDNFAYKANSLLVIAQVILLKIVIRVISDKIEIQPPPFSPVVSIGIWQLHIIIPSPIGIADTMFALTRDLFVYTKKPKSNHVQVLVNQNLADVIQHVVFYLNQVTTIIVIGASFEKNCKLKTASNLILFLLIKEIIFSLCRGIAWLFSAFANFCISRRINTTFLLSYP